MGVENQETRDLHILEPDIEEFDSYEEDEDEEKAEEDEEGEKAEEDEEEEYGELEKFKGALATEINHSDNIKLEGTPSSSLLRPQERLYKVMEVRRDMRDTCFTEKVQLHKQSILALFTALSAATDDDDDEDEDNNDNDDDEDADLDDDNEYEGDDEDYDDDDDEILQFLLHSKASLEVVGYCGDKQVMQQLLWQKVGICNDLLHMGTLEPGLYACLQYPVLHIFLWLPPSEDQKRKATQKELACNFIRYIMDLCSTVHVCIPELILPTSEVAVMRNNMKASQSHRLQISRVKASEDDITISPVFSLSLELEDSCHTAQNKFLLSEGLSRFALLFSHEYTESTPPATKKEETTMDRLTSLVETWKRANYDVDFTRLPDEEFLVLLKHTNLESFQEYEDMCKSFKEAKDACFSNPENLFSDDIDALKILFRNTLLKSKILMIMNNTWEAYCYGAHTLGKSGLELCLLSTSLPANFLPNFSTLEVQLLKHLNSQVSINNVNLGLVFDGARVKIVKADTMEAVFPEYQDYGMTLMHSPSGMYKKDLLELRQQIGLVDKDNRLFEYVTFNACHGYPDGFLLTGVTLQMEVRSEKIHVKIIKLQPDSSVPDLLLWIDSLCKKQFGKIEEDDNFYNACEIYYSSLPEYIFGEIIIPMLKKKLRFEPIMELESKQKSSTEQFLAHHKQTMGIKTGHEITLSILKIEVKSNSVLNELVLTEQFDYASREVLQWKAVELVPMSNDIEETLQHSSGDEQENLFIPRVTPESQFALEVDLRKEKLLKCVLLKSNDVLFFLQKIGSRCVTIYRYPLLGCAPIVGAERIEIFERACDIIAFDESSRTFACYEKSLSTAKFYRFDEAFRHCYGGAEITLNTDFGIACIQWMELIAGKGEVVFIDDSWRVSVFEIVPSPVMKCKHIQLPGPFSRAVISTDGSCLICLYAESGVAISSVGSSENQVVAGSSGGSKLLLRVYLLGDSLSHLKDVPVTLPVSDFTKVDARVVLFGSQMHLVIHSSEKPKDIFSLVLNISLSKEYIALKEVRKWSPTSDNEEQMTHLDYIFHIYDKFPMRPPLVDQLTSRGLTLVLAETQLQRKTAGNPATPSECTAYVQDCLGKLAKKGKYFENLDITVVSYYLAEFVNSPIGVSQNNAAALVGTWISKLLSLIPVQIARAENNSLRPLINGLEINSNLGFKDAVSLSNLIKFGFYDAILNNWDGNITVISAMGEQSSGRPYLLNYLTGSLYDIAGSRCTDGVWMTTRIASDRLYVLLYFEGLESLERTDQESMLLSLLSAALTNVTLFNRKDLDSDKEMELQFNRLQSGVSLVNQDPKLFQGLFCIVMKNCDTADIEDLKSKLVGKIGQMCSETNDNFLLKMYGGKVEIVAMAPFSSADFQESVGEIADTIQNAQSSYNNGRSFMHDMKLLIAQICAKDWSPLDAKRVALRIQLLRPQLTSTVRLGCLSMESRKKTLISLDTEDEIEDLLLVQVDNDVSLKLPDAGLELFPFHPSATLGSILEELICEFETIKPRNGENDEIWFSLFKKFLLELVERRKKRVLSWLKCNIDDYSEDGDVLKLKLEAIAALAELKEGLTLCGTKCTFCFLKCILEKGHPYDHSCKGLHVCTELCSLCSNEESDATTEQCADASGHDGLHNCRKKSHTCGRPCDQSTSSSNCNNSCAFKVEHSGAHHCNSLQHMCKMVCDAPACINTCISPLEYGHHEKHACHQTFCLSKCLMPSCSRSCATEDHFHALDPNAKHLCGNEHLCQITCEAEGICEVQTELKQIHVSPGKKALFEYEYEYESEQNGLKKGCCIVIPAFYDKHDGMHVHTSDPNVTHYCDKTCPSCGYFCNMPFGHAGLHETVHGITSVTKFVSESDDIGILDWKCKSGDSGKAEMCMMHCKSQGRGHIHLIPCPKGEGGDCTSTLYDGARHETRKYGPDFDTPKDEMTHKAYWRHARFKDPCAKEEHELFSLCVSIIFVVSINYSMLSSDFSPILSQLHDVFPNRLGCVYESILGFIRKRLATMRDDTVAVVLFDRNASIVVPPTEMTESIVDVLCDKSLSPDGGPIYSNGLRRTMDVLDELRMDNSTQAKKPIVIFVGDGGNYAGFDPVWCVGQMKERHPDLVLHTIMFGNDSNDDILERMAEEGEGIYRHSLNKVELSQSFEVIAQSLLSMHSNVL